MFQHVNHVVPQGYFEKKRSRADAWSMASGGESCLCNAQWYSAMRDFWKTSGKHEDNIMIF